MLDLDVDVLGLVVTSAQLLADADWGIRAAAVEALGRLDEDVGRLALEGALRVEKHPFVRERIQISLQSPGAR